MKISERVSPSYSILGAETVAGIPKRRHEGQKRSKAD